MDSTPNKCLHEIHAENRLERDRVSLCSALDW